MTLTTNSSQSLAEPAGPLKGRTRASGIFERLRKDILECRLRPGQKLRFDELREAYDIGLSPLREALVRLAADGLVVLEDQRGFHVAPVSRADLQDVTRMRVELEAMALRLAIEQGDDQWESEIVASFHRLSKLPKHGIDNDRIIGSEWEQRHRAFHQALVAACGSPWLLHFRGLLYDQADRYRRLSLQYLTFPRDDQKEHRELMTAALARDAEAASSLIRRHIATTTEIVLAADPTIFGDDNDEIRKNA